MIFAIPASIRLPMVGLFAWAATGACEPPIAHNKEQSSKLQEEQVVFLPDTLRIFNVALNIAEQKPLTFSNGDSLTYCATRQAWQQAVQLQQPAWCYMDSVRQEGILYNYFALTDKRGLSGAIQPISTLQARAIADSLQKSAFSLSGYFPPSFCTERNYRGSFYNLGFVNYWIAEGNALVIDTKKGRAYLVQPHPGNGYRILASVP